MAERPAQNFANHVRHDRWLYVYAAVYLAGLVLGLAAAYEQSARLAGVGVAVLAVGATLAAVNAREYGLTVQNRIIRLEMQLRLARLLDGDLASRAGEFTLRQLVALRFASDAELPALARRVLEEKIADGKTIKQMVKEWQGDHLRV